MSKFGEITWNMKFEGRLPYLEVAVCPALPDPVLGPDVVSVLGQKVDQFLHPLVQLYTRQIQSRRLVAVRLKIATMQITQKCEENSYQQQQL